MFHVEAAVPFYREFFAAFGQPGGPFQRALTLDNLGRTRFLAHRLPTHANGTPFGYRVACGEGDEAVYFEGNLSAKVALFKFAPYLREHCGFQVELAGEEPSAPVVAVAPTVPQPALAPSDAGAPMVVYLSRDGQEEEIQGRDVPGLLRALVERLVARDWLADDKLPVAVSRTRYLVAEAPFHAGDEKFKEELQVSDYFIETAWSPTEVLIAIRAAAEHLGLHFELDGAGEGETADPELAMEADGSAIRYWKLTPEADGAAWTDWLSGRCATVGWPELADLTDCTEDEFESRVRDHKLGSSKKDKVWQAWTFRERIRAGDMVVASIGMHTVLGAGRVVSGYSYRPEHMVTGAGGRVAHPHVIEVDWTDTTRRSVRQPGWRRALVALTQEEFERVQATPADERAGQPGPSEPLPLDELLTLTVKQAKQLRIHEHLRLVFGLDQSIDEVAAALARSTPQKQLKGVFGDPSEQWRDRTVGWAKTARAEGVLAQRAGRDPDDVRARLDRAPSEASLSEALG